MLKLLLQKKVLLVKHLVLLVMVLFWVSTKEQDLVKGKDLLKKVKDLVLMLLFMMCPLERSWWF